MMMVEMVSGECVEVPEGKILVAWANPDYEAEAPYEVFEQDVPEKGICAYGIFETSLEFLKAWYEMVEEPRAMWYWVMDGDCLVLSGACDPMDIETFEEHFELEGLLSAGIDKLGLSPHTYKCLRFGHVDTVGGLLMNTDEDLREIKGLGPGRIAEIKEKVGAFCNCFEASSLENRLESAVVRSGAERATPSALPELGTRKEELRGAKSLG